jgi:hypothetical protein
LDGRPFSFAGGHEYLQEIYRDTSCDITIEKSAQMGVSVWAILDSLHGMKFGRYPHGILYLFPSRIFVTEFSKTKLQNIIDENDFRNWFTETDVTNVKRVPFVNSFRTFISTPLPEIQATFESIHSFILS